MLAAVIAVALAVSAGVAAQAAVDRGPSTSAAPTGGAPGLKPLLGGWSKAWPWYRANIGPVDIYRYYDSGWHFDTYQQNTAHAARAANAVSDYSFKLPPVEVAAGLHDARLRTFIASTPKTIILTNHHEPEEEIERGDYTAAEFRAAIARLNQLVDVQNVLDGGTRRVSVVLMGGTFTGLRQRNPANYWPKDPVTDLNQADLIAVDAFAVPYATNTSGVPAGYTNGVQWKQPAALLAPVVRFASENLTAWGVSEFGYLEDVNNPTRKAQAITDAIAYARANGAVMFEYFDSIGPRGDWQLRYNNPPVPSTNNKSNAVRAWKAALAAS